MGSGPGPEVVGAAVGLAVVGEIVGSDAVGETDAVAVAVAAVDVVTLRRGVLYKGDRMSFFLYSEGGFSGTQNNRRTGGRLGGRA